MAKRRIVRTEEDEEEEPQEDRKPAFKPPEFDETEFLQTENRSAKLIYISLSTALVAGIITYGFMTLLHSIGSDGVFTIPLIIPFIFFGVAVYIFTRFGIDIKALEWKKWLENGFMYVLAWFAIWLLSMNPPFSDFSEPVISEPLIEVEVDSGSTIHYLDDQMFIDDRLITIDSNEYRSISSLEDITTVRIYSMITDNWKLEKKSVVFEYKDDSGNWNSIEEGKFMNVSVGRYDSIIDTEKNVSNAMDETWLVSDDEIRSDHMFWVSFSTKNMTQLEGIDPDGPINMRVVFSAEDSRGNEAIVEVPFKL